MTREEFIAKIENPDDVERVMARVDEGEKKNCSFLFLTQELILKYNPG